MDQSVSKGGGVRARVRRLVVATEEFADSHGSAAGPGATRACRSRTHRERRPRSFMGSRENGSVTRSRKLEPRPFGTMRGKSQSRFTCPV